jgi:hypothetical protein
MINKDINSILIANWYFTKCKIENPISYKTELARKYLNDKIKTLLFEKSKVDISLSK